MPDAPADTASPEQPRPEEKKSLLDRIGPAFAIAMTALAAVFGSMSAAQLQQAMYWKSQAAQDQSKSANQWSLFGFKRSRALEMEAAAARARADSGYLLLQFPADSGDAAAWLNGDGPPRTDLPKPAGEKLVKLVNDIRERKPESDILALAAEIPVADINKAIDDAENFIFDTTEVKWDAVVKAAKKLAQKEVDAAARKSADQKVDEAKKARADAAQSRVFAMEDRRYRGEGFLNNGLGYLYEARVKFSTAESDSHRKKSELLGYAMLVAQVGAVIASLALARKRGGFMWLFVALIGFAALGFGGYALIPASVIKF